MLPVPQTCSACGRINDPTAIYCGHCGVRIGISESPINVALPINDLPAGFRLGNHGRYQIERLIGRGGFGETYLAQDIDDRRLCIVKRPRATVWADATALQSFDSEARALAQLNIPGHAHIPFIYDYLAEYHALVMQYIDGQDLRSLIEQRLAPISEIQALQFMGAIGSALSICIANNQCQCFTEISSPRIFFSITMGRSG